MVRGRRKNEKREKIRGEEKRREEKRREEKRKEMRGNRREIIIQTEVQKIKI